MRLGIVASQFNAEVSHRLLERARAQAQSMGVEIAVTTVAGALEIPLALQWMAQSGRFDALVALGAVIRGETYHFEVVANESARGVRDRAADLQPIVAPHLDRTFARLSPIERAILYIGTFELAAHPETPFKVVLNEAIELGKSFGATDGHRFVNGVLQKIAAALRPDEVARSRKIA